MKYVKQIGRRGPQPLSSVSSTGRRIRPFFNADSPDERDREAGKRRGDRKFSHGYHEHDVYSGYRRDY